jgi:hypothetical protein
MATFNMGSSPFNPSAKNNKNLLNRDGQDIKDTPGNQFGFRQEHLKSFVLFVLFSPVHPLSVIPCVHNRLT